MHPLETTLERNVRLFDCESPVAMVTGSAAPRVGRRIAEYFRAENFRLLVHAHQPSPTAETYVRQLNRDGGPTACLLTGPVQDELQVAKWVATAQHEFGRIDVMVNSAAVWFPKPLEETSEADFEHFFRVNALGTALCCRHFGLAMAQQSSGGAIINIGDWAIERPYLDHAAYFLSKGMLPTLTRSMAVELATRNRHVRVNCILPGPVQLADGVGPEQRQQIVADSLLRREGSADDVAGAALFLAVSPFITGVCLPVDGGRSIHAGDSADGLGHSAASPQQM